MTEKNVVLLRSNPVDPDSRVEKEANSLLKAGYNVTILAWDRESKYRINETLLKLTNGKVKICRFGIPATFGEGFKNLKAFLEFQMRLASWLIRNNKSFQVIHACDFDTAYTAYHCAKLLRKKLIFDIFDYLYSRPEGKFSIFKKYIGYLQQKIINYADATIICTEKRKEQIKGSSPKKLTVIHNSPFQLNSDNEKLQLSAHRVKLVYVGILQEHRFLKELGNIVKESDNLELHIGGFGKYENYFKKLSVDYQNIIFYGKLSYQKTLELENSCDIMTAIYDPSIDNHYYAAPNKFYEALMLGKPLIMVKGTGMSEFVKNYKIGQVISYNTTDLANAIENLRNNKEEWDNISLKMKEIYDENFSWRKMECRLVELYHNIFEEIGEKYEG